MNSKLLDLLALEAKEIAISFEKASIEGQGTPQEVSDRRENSFVNEFVAKYFPFPFKVVKGNIIDSYGNRSNSIDCIVLSPSHPYTINPKNEKASIIFADGVDYAIEIKPDLASKDEIERSLMQVQSVKILRRKRNGLFFMNRLKPEKLETYYQIPSLIFANNTYSEIRLLLTYIMEYYIRENVPLHEQFDYIVVNNRGIVLNSRKHAYCSMTQKGFCFAETNENTLVAMLFLMNEMPRSEAPIGPNVLSFYVDKNVFNDNVKTFHDINNRLNEHFKIFE